jgi:hypothetical protein
MLMRCLVGHSWSPGIEKAPDEGALWVCGIGARNRLLATMNDFGRLLRSPTYRRRWANCVRLFMALARAAHGIGVA